MRPLYVVLLVGCGAVLNLAPFHTFVQTELMPNRMVAGAYGPDSAVEAALAAVK